MSIVDVNFHVKPWSQVRLVYSFRTNALRVFLYELIFLRQFLSTGHIRSVFVPKSQKFVCDLGTQVCIPNHRRLLTLS